MESAPRFGTSSARSRGCVDEAIAPIFHGAEYEKKDWCGLEWRAIRDLIKKRNPDIPWREMAALRDRIIHGYFRIDYSVVWSVIIQDLPEIEPKISALLEKMDARTR